MKKNQEHIEELLERFFDGQTIEAEEQLLADYFREADAFPEEWQVYKELFDSFKTDAYDFKEEELDAMLTPADDKKPKAVRLLPWASVACVAAIVGLFVWHPWETNPVSETPSIAQVKTVKEAAKNNVDVKDHGVVEDKPLAASERVNEAIAAKQSSPKQLAESKTITNKNYRKRTSLPQPETEDKSTQSAKQTTQKVNSQEITTSELIETINLLVDVGNENITITSLPDNKGFAVRTVSSGGESNSFMLRRCAEGSSLELKSQVINF